MSSAAEPSASAIVVSFGNRAETLALIDRLVGAMPVVVCDNDGDFPHGSATSVIRPGQNVGFAAGANLAAAAAAGEFLVLANPDTNLDATAAGTLVARIRAEPTLGALGPRLVYPDGSPQINGGQFSGVIAETSRSLRLGAATRRIRGRTRRDATSGSTQIIPRDWISGAVLALRTEAFRAVGGFDVGYWMYFEDEDLCRRLRGRGYGAAVDPSVTVTHRLGGSRVGDDPYRSRAYQASRARYHHVHSPPLLARFVARSARRLGSRD